MTFTTTVAAPSIRHAVDLIWDWRVEPGDFQLERILPQPGSGLIINLLDDETRVYSDDAAQRCERSPGCVFSGQFTHSFVIDSTEQIAVMGVIFPPGGATSLLREPMDRLASRHTALEDLVGPSGRALRQRLLNTPTATARLDVLQTWLRAHCTSTVVHASVRFALGAINSAPQIQRVGSVIAASGLSPRRFGTLFREQVGIGPKQYARMQRFRAVLTHSRQGGPIEWSRIAADCGFHDQPHLVREFRQFAGMTPTAYLALRGQNVNHVPLARTTEKT
ncbi:MAG: helix-turn-helix transcriptional regulator [Dokdonella sp.]|uniref:helix-turn-helix transcriptional regulator n=1 Tax=Dokdonella sp. TaxID=2291710 RepID=UPI003263CBE7